MNSSNRLKILALWVVTAITLSMLQFSPAAAVESSPTPAPNSAIVTPSPEPSGSALSTSDPTITPSPAPSEATVSTPSPAPQQQQIATSPAVGTSKLVDELFLKVVGGTAASISDAPWQVALLRTTGSSQYQAQFCGGSLMNNKWIITAAHCMTDRTTSNTRVLAGTNTLSRITNTGLAISRIIVHPSWNSVTKENDIALIELSSPVALNGSTMAAIPLASSKPASGTSALVTGWGSTSSTYSIYSTPSYPDTLQKATVFTKSDSICLNDVGASYRATSMLCAMTDLWMKDTCQGDSGGPLATQANGVWVLSGITSWGIGCADLTAGVYTNVANYTGWVKSQLPGITGSKPVIAGGASPKVGALLQVTTATWNPSGVSLNYQWKIDGSTVGTSNTYIPTLSDQGKQISVAVTGSLTNYDSVTLASDLTSAVGAGNLTFTPVPTISGTKAVGQTLTATPGTWDADVALSYQWFRGTTAIPEATASTYTLVGSDLNTAISVKVTGTKPGYTTVTKASAATTPIAAGTLAQTPTPTISGSLQTGQTLTAAAGTWTDGVNVAYQWFRGTTAIAGATSSTYTLTGTDFNTAITVKTTGTKTGYTTVTRASTATALIGRGSLTLTPTPTVSGTLKVAGRLTATPGTWDSGTVLTYQWFRGTTAISGATASGYTLTVADYNTSITVKVTGTKLGYTTVTQASAAPETAVVAGDLVLTPTPTISGSVTTGQRLSATPGTWDAGTTVTYQWFRGDTAITGATAATYILTSSDYDNTIAVKTTGTKTGYTPITKTSTATATVTYPLTLTPVPTISGTKAVGQTLTATPGTWDADVALSYQWFRGTTAIPEATASTYTLVGSDLNTAISVKVTGTKPGYTTVTKASAATTPIAAGTLALTPVPTMSGTLQTGQTLTATAGTWTDGVNVAYQWFRGTTAIAGATSSTYTLTGTDFNTAITVKTTGTKTGYTTVTRASTATALIGRGSLTLTPTPTVSGTLKVAGRLTATPGTWDSGTVLTYQWFRGTTAISGATASGYTLTVADYNTSITVKVTGTKLGYTTVTQASAAPETAVVAGDLVLTPTPTISGSVTTGQRLSATPGTWDAGTTVTYQWFRGDTAITGATAATYILTSSDYDNTIAVKTTGTKTGYTPITKTSTATATVTYPLTLTPVPTISGTKAVGQTLTATPGTWDADVALSYQWFRGTTAIPEATASTYTLVGSDLNTAISVKVTGTKPGYTTVTKASAATTPIAAGTLAQTPTPTISGSLQTGQTLTAAAGTWTDGVNVAYQWFRGTTAIAGATSSTYTLTGTDFNTAITVKTTGTKTGYTTVTRASTATALIGRGSLTLTPTPTVSGTLKVAGRLTATPGTWDSGTVLTYQWFRGTTAISGATASGYTLTVADYNTSITVKVTGTKLGYTTVTQASAAPETAVVAGDLVLTPTPTISGSTTVGQLLTATPGTWDAGTTVTYQWFRGDTALTSNSSLSRTYRLSENEYNNQVFVVVTGSKNGYFSITKTSVETSTVGLGAFASAPNPSVSGTLKVGQTLTASLGIWSPVAESLDYQWYRNGAAISGANSAQYVVTEDDQGKSLSVSVIAHKYAYLDTSRTSASTLAVAAVSFAAGSTLRVGSQVPAMTFRSTNSASTSCYWARLSGLSGSLNDILSNDVGYGQRIVTLSGSEFAFESSSGCGTWVALTALASAPQYSIGGTGVFSVPQQIVPGTYISSNNNSTSCYWARLSGFSGDLDDIVSNDIGSGQRIVTITNSDVGFESSRCGNWTLLSNLPISRQTTIPATGLFSVQRQILPGTYRSSASSSSCYWARLSNYSGLLSAITTNHYGAGNQTVTIYESDQGFETNGCGTWTRIY